MPDLLFLTANQALGHALTEQLPPATGWTVTLVTTSAEALAILMQKPPAIILAEAALLDKPTAQNLAAQSDAFFLLIGEAEEATAQSATEIFPKPLRLGHLLARLQFYLQAQQMRSVAYPLGRWTFTQRARELTADGETPLRLTDKESSLLEYLCRATEAVHRDELLADIWGYDGSIDTHTLETHIYRLRQRLPQGQDLFIVKNGAYKINPDWAG